MALLGPVPPDRDPTQDEVNLEDEVPRSGSSRQSDLETPVSAKLLANPQPTRMKLPEIPGDKANLRLPPALEEEYRKSRRRQTEESLQASFDCGSLHAEFA